MAFTFTGQTQSDVIGAYTLSATTDASSAAGSVTIPFSPSLVLVYDSTNANKYEWSNQMPAASIFKTVTGGGFTYATTNGITVTGPSSSPAAPFTLTLGTAIHTNSSTYRIVCFP